eukprot:351612-Chlamydomonas_euryale.AAC.3
MLNGTIPSCIVGVQTPQQIFDFGAASCYQLVLLAATEKAPRAALVQEQVDGITTGLNRIQTAV